MLSAAMALLRQANQLGCLSGWIHSNRLRTKDGRIKTWIKKQVLSFFMPLLGKKAEIGQALAQKTG
jgi:hypothetical protein